MIYFEGLFGQLWRKRKMETLYQLNMRISNPSYVKYDLVTLNQVQGHIKMSLVMENHYQTILVGNLNITKMYELFVLQLPDTTVHEQFY